MMVTLVSGFVSSSGLVCEASVPDESPVDVEPSVFEPSVDEPEPLVVEDESTSVLPEVSAYPVGFVVAELSPLELPPSLPPSDDPEPPEDDPDPSEDDPDPPDDSVNSDFSTIYISSTYSYSHFDLRKS